MSKKLMVDTQKRPKKIFKEILKKAPVLLPTAHDALTARLLELAGFDAYQVGIFGLVGSQFAFPDTGLTSYKDNINEIRNIICSSNLPVVIDGEVGYGDAKNVFRTVQGYEAAGASAIFIEDQKMPNKCGHMEIKKVVPCKTMVSKIKAAVAARKNPDTFIIARTDARQSCGLNKAIDRLKHYIDSGADGVFADGLQGIKDVEKVANTFKDFPLGIVIFEGEHKATSWIDQKILKELGYSMILYPTTIMFSVTKTLQKIIKNLKSNKPVPKEDRVNFKEFEDIIDLNKWKEIEERFPIIED